jgi:hypothetical protein
VVAAQRGSFAGSTCKVWNDSPELGAFKLNALTALSELSARFVRQVKSPGFSSYFSGASKSTCHDGRLMNGRDLCQLVKFPT